jgi:pilus assembly protein Flp/PilA
MAAKYSVFGRFLRDEQGATTIEYALIAALIVIAVLAAIRGVADANTQVYQRIEDAVTSV